MQGWKKDDYMGSSFKKKVKLEEVLKESEA